jgi:hypothetical protein
MNTTRLFLVSFLYRWDGKVYGRQAYVMARDEDLAVHFATSRLLTGEDRFGGFADVRVRNCALMGEIQSTGPTAITSKTKARDFMECPWLDY